MHFSRRAWFLLGVIAGAALGLAVVASCTYRVHTEEYVWDSPEGPAGPGHRRAFEVFLGDRLYEHRRPGETNPAAAAWVFGLNAAAMAVGGAAGFGLARLLTRARPTSVARSAAEPIVAPDPRRH
jgi:hypothetical protein